MLGAHENLKVMHKELMNQCKGKLSLLNLEGLKRYGETMRLLNGYLYRDYYSP